MLGIYFSYSTIISPLSCKTIFGFGLSFASSIFFSSYSIFYFILFFFSFFLFIVLVLLLGSSILEPVGDIFCFNGTVHTETNCLLFYCLRVWTLIHLENSCSKISNCLPLTLQRLHESSPEDGAEVFAHLSLSINLYK